MTTLEQLRQSLEEALENVNTLLAEQEEQSFMDTYLQDPEAEEWIDREAPCSTV
jgi:hypothetical protein